MIVFRKIWRALFSWNTRFEIHPIALLPTKFHRLQRRIYDLANIYNGSFFIFFIVMVFQNCQNQFQQCFGFFPSKLYWIFRRKHYGNEYFLWATKNVNCETTFQTWSRTEKKNYRPVSIFSDTSKIYERFFIKQLEEYFRVPLYKYHYGLRERYTIISAIPLVILNEENFWKCSWREP